ncbi:MAG: excinuclease ABC subunit A, partial [Planctomycetota bacterium]|nr:excinuclease ABC subunit A [Planctomycetota bacterium]
MTTGPSNPTAAPGCGPMPIPGDGQECILVQGARQHNLKNITLSIPRDKIVVVTGLSGSGKSSLAFDTIYAEGQRRYVESLSAYARQFLEQMEKPDVDAIEGLPPTIAIHQRRGAFSPRSTVATATEIHDYLRLLYARVGTATCPKCGREIRPQRVDQIVEQVLGLAPGTRLTVLAPLIRGQRGEHKDVLRNIVADGFVRVRIDNQMHEVREMPALSKNTRHTIEAVIDRLVVKEAVRGRLTESVEAALRMTEGVVIVSHETAAGEWRNTLYSERYACTRCNISFEELTPRLFSFNSPYGACPQCHGLGTFLEFDEDLVVPDPEKTLGRGALAPWKNGPRRYQQFFEAALERFVRDFGADRDVPFEKLPAKLREALLYGGTPPKRRQKATEEDAEEAWEGVLPSLKRFAETVSSQHVQRWIEQFMSEQPCPACHGARLRPEARAVRVGDKAIHEVAALSIDAAAGFFASLKLDGEKKTIARQVLGEIRNRLRFMQDVGIAYLTLDRATDSLSGSEAQRIRLATQ